MTTLITSAALDSTIPNYLATLTSKQNLSNKTLKSTRENVTITNTAATGTLNFDVATQPISVYNTASANFTINVRGDAATTLDSLLSIGESTTVSLLIPNGATAYYPTVFQIDGVTITPKYQGGTVFNRGNASCTDLYVLFIIKLAANSWSVYVSQTKFA